MVAIGVPDLVIVSDTVRVTDIVIDFVNGLVVAIGDGLTDCVTDLVNGLVVAIPVLDLVIVGDTV